MSRTLTPDSTIDNLKKEAKRWLKGLRAGDEQARQRLIAATPTATANPGLRDVQLALAREHGLAGWAALRAALDDLAMERRSTAERVDIVLRSAWGGDPAAAGRLITRWPDITSHDLYIAAAAGNIAEVERRIAGDPGAATRKGGALDWEPLLYVAYARLPSGEKHARDLARILLDHGANPNAQFDDGWGNPFKVVTGVIGQGEGDKPPHPQANELALLLIERGADPYDSQALYNTSITRDDTTWLDFLWTHSERRDQLGKWRDKAWTIGGNVPLNALDYLLGNAVAANHLRRTEWLLMHGANADGVHAYSKRPLREEALVYGHTAMADLLVRYGAAEPVLQGEAAFQAACMRLDKDAARKLMEQNPECLRNPAPMLTAARQGRADVVALLLALGMDVDVADGIEQRGLQVAVAGGSLEVVKLLVAHGADIDRPTTSLGGGAMGYAAHFDRGEIATYLAPLTRDVHELTYLGMTDRLQELFAEDPQLPNAVLPRAGITPLFCLPEDEDAAVEMTTLLMAHGADPNCKNKDGLTAEQAARKRGLIDPADLMAGNETV